MLLTREMEALAAAMGTLEQQLTERLPPETDAYAHKFSNGVTVQVSRKESERWVPVDGQSDEFWGWVWANNLGQQFSSRVLKQEGVDKWRDAHRTATMPDGELPPFIKRMTIVTPKVGVKGLTV